MDWHVDNRNARWGRRLVAGLVVAVGLVSGTVHPVSAGDAGTEETDTSVSLSDAERRDKLVFDEFDVRFDKPSGWRIEKATGMAEARLVAAGEPDAQLDVRVSESIPEDRTGGYVSAFHSRLKKAGFVEVESDEEAQYGDGPTGNETEYRGQSAGRTFRLVVWYTHRDSRVWIVTAFFPAEGRSLFYDGFKSLVGSMRLES